MLGGFSHVIPPIHRISLPKEGRGRGLKIRIVANVGRNVGRNVGGTVGENVGEKFTDRFTERFGEKFGKAEGSSLSRRSGQGRALGSDRKE